MLTQGVKTYRMHCDQNSIPCAICDWISVTHLARCKCNEHSWYTFVTHAENVFPAQNDLMNKVILNQKLQI